MTNEIYAVISTDTNGNEGLFALTTELGSLPLVALHPDKLEVFKKIVSQTKMVPGMKDKDGYELKSIKVVKFTSREDVETICDVSQA